MSTSLQSETRCTPGHWSTLIAGHCSKHTIHPAKTMRVSQLRLPDPLEERDDGEDQQSQSMGGAESGHRQLVDDYSDCGLSDIDLDRMSLPSSTGLSQLSVVDDTGDDDFSDEKLRPAKGRLEMSVASTRLSGAAPEDGLQKPHETRSTSDNTNCDIRDGYSIISHLDGCRSPSYSITGVRTPPPPPLRSPSFVVGQVNLDGTQSSLPRNLKEYIDGLSATEKQNNRQDEHQKNFEMWLKSVTPYSQRTMDSDDVSSMSSLASPLRVPSTHSSHILQGKKQTVASFPVILAFTWHDFTDVEFFLSRTNHIDERAFRATFGTLTTSLIDSYLANTRSSPPCILQMYWYATIIDQLTDQSYCAIIIRTICST